MYELTSILEEQLTDENIFDFDFLDGDMPIDNLPSLTFSDAPDSPESDIFLDPLPLSPEIALPSPLSDDSPPASPTSKGENSQFHGQGRDP